MEYKAENPTRMAAPMAGIAFLVGLSTGAVIALLVAPRRGVELRGQLLRKMSALQSQMSARKEQFGAKADDAGESVEEALTRVHQALKRERLESPGEDQEKL